MWETRRSIKVGCGSVLLALGAMAQQAERTPVFDAASIRIVAEGGQGMMKVLGPGYLVMRGGPGTGDPGRIVWGGATMTMLLTRAWGVDAARIVGPDWLHWQTLYRVEATMPANTTKERFRKMFRNLLIERFQLRLRHESRPYPGYRLVVAPGGPKLKPASHAEPPPLSAGAVDSKGCPILRNETRQFEARSHTGAVCDSYRDMSMAEFTQSVYLIGAARLPDGSAGHIVDGTGLTGTYDFTLRFDGASGSRRVITVRGARVGETPALEDVGSGLPDVFTAMERQLGLKLRKVKDIPLDTIVIESGNPIPIAN
jgi:uncharacterized protein (TIGR03435 family)